MKHHIILKLGKKIAKLDSTGGAEFEEVKGKVVFEQIAKTTGLAVAKLMKLGWKFDRVEIDKEVKEERPKMESKTIGYVRNMAISNGRTLRIEVMGGDVPEHEAMFLKGTLHFIAGTLSKDDVGHIQYVADMMKKLIAHLIKKMRSGGEEHGSSDVDDVFNKGDE